VNQNTSGFEYQSRLAEVSNLGEAFGFVRGTSTGRVFVTETIGLPNKSYCMNLLSNGGVMLSSSCIDE